MDLPGPPGAGVRAEPGRRGGDRYAQNSVIRNLAIEADKQVADHMEVLEDTGLVEPRTFDSVAADVLK